MQRMSPFYLNGTETPAHKSSIQPTSPEPSFTSSRASSSSAIMADSAASLRAPKDVRPFMIASSIAILRVRTSSSRHLTSLFNLLPPLLAITSTMKSLVEVLWPVYDLEVLQSSIESLRP
jgi:hypothetical protein